MGNNKFKKEKYDSHKDNLIHEEYIKWFKNIFEILKPKIKIGGRICINIGDGKNGAIPTHSDIIQTMKELGYISFSTIIWNKNTTSNRCSWGSWLSPSSPSFSSTFEYILVFGNKIRKLQYKGETALVAKELNRGYISIDISKNYCDIAKERLNE